MILPGYMQGKIIFVSLFPIAISYFVSMVCIYFCLSFQKKHHDTGSSPPGSVYDFKGTTNSVFIVKDDVDC